MEVFIWIYFFAESFSTLVIHWVPCSDFSAGLWIKWSHIFRSLLVAFLGSLVLWADFCLKAGGHWWGILFFFFFFFNSEKQYNHHCLCQDRRQIAGGSCLSLARILRCWGDTNYSRRAGLCHFLRIGLALSTKAPDGGSGIPLFDQSKAWPFHSTFHHANSRFQRGTEN